MKIELQALEHAYPGGDKALDGVDLTLDGNEPVAIIGQNGAGKTTLVKHFNGILRPTGGKVLMDGIDVNERSTAEWSMSFRIPTISCFWKASARNSNSVRARSA